MRCFQLIALGSDHGGYELKQVIKGHLDSLRIEYKDFGCYSEDSCDYADFALIVAEKVAKGEFEKGILLCGTGIGMSIAANKVPGIRCAVCHDVFSASATAKHNDSNILAMGGRVIGSGHALAIVDAWLNCTFEGGRHARRVEKIKAIEAKYSKEV